jgi:hypothetical protein
VTGSSRDAREMPVDDDISRRYRWKWTDACGYYFWSSLEIGVIKGIAKHFVLQYRLGSIYETP